MHYPDHSLTHRLHWYVHNRELHDAAGGVWNLRAMLCLSLGDWFPQGSSPSRTLVYLVVSQRTRPSVPSVALCAGLVPSTLVTWDVGLTPGSHIQME